jgi:hypothetical protein
VVLGHHHLAAALAGMADQIGFGQRLQRIEVDDPDGDALAF